MEILYLKTEHRFVYIYNTRCFEVQNKRGNIAVSHFKTSELKHMEEVMQRFDIYSSEDYVEVGLDPEMVLNFIEDAPLEQFSPMYVTCYFLLKRDLVSS